LTPRFMANSIHCSDSLSFSFNCSLVNGILTYVAIEEVFGASTFELLDIIMKVQTGVPSSRQVQFMYLSLRHSSSQNGVKPHSGSKSLRNIKCLCID